MSLAYKVLYAVGITPWEKMDSPLANKQISALFDREEAGREPPFGRRWTSAAAVASGP